MNESCSPSPEAQLDSRRCRRRASAAVIEFVTIGSGCEERRVVDFLRAPPLLRDRLAFRAVPLRADAFFPALFFLAAIASAPLTVSRRSIPCGGVPFTLQWPPIMAIWAHHIHYFPQSGGRDVRRMFGQRALSADRRKSTRLDGLATSFTKQRHRPTV